MLELDALRGLCAVGVLLFHYTTFYQAMFNPKEGPLFVMPWAPYRIQLFAMISGFVNVMVLEKTRNPLRFAVSRMSRLYPSYIMAVVVVSVLMVIFPLPNKIVMTWPKFISNLTMIQSWTGFDNNIDRSWWFLAPEITFYVILFLVFLVRMDKYIEWIGAAGLILVVLHGRYGGAGPVQVPAILILSKMLVFWPYFFAGILFYRLKAAGDYWRLHALLGACFIAQNLISDDVYIVISFAFCVILFYLLIYRKLGWIAQKPFIWLGTISYSLFLIHQNMGCVVIFYLYKTGANAWLRLLIPIMVSVTLAVLLTYVIERPAMNYIRKRIRV